MLFYAIITQMKKYFFLNQAKIVCVILVTLGCPRLNTELQGKMHSHIIYSVKTAHYTKHYLKLDI
jgi:hypothetical protein